MGPLTPWLDPGASPSDVAGTGALLAGVQHDEAPAAVQVPLAANSPEFFAPDSVFGSGADSRSDTAPADQPASADLLPLEPAGSVTLVNGSLATSEAGSASPGHAASSGPLAPPGTSAGAGVAAVSTIGPSPTLAPAQGVITAVAALAPSNGEPATVPAAPPSAAAAAARHPALSFEANRGQFGANTAFVAHDGGLTARLGAASADFTLPADGTGAPATLHMELAGGNASAAAVGIGRLPGTVNYLTGSDPSAWVTNVPQFAQAAFRNVYAGVDVAYHADSSGHLEYDFVLAPGADPGAIRLAFGGADAVSLDGSGNLILATAAGQLVQHSPVAFQGDTAVATSFVLLGGGQVGFWVGSHDTAKPLVIDPTISYSTFRGTSVGDNAAGVAFDPAGNAYVVGTRIIPVDPLDHATPNTRDAFVAKYTPDGALVYLTYIGGTYSSTNFDTNPGDDTGTGIAVGPVSATDPTPVPYITGYTNSSDFPIAGPAYQTHLTHDLNPRGASINAFLTKLNPTGDGLLYSSYFGRIHYGNNATFTYRGQSYPGTVVGVFDELAQRGRGVAVDRYANAYIVGETFGIAAIAVPFNEHPPGDPLHLADAWMHSVDTVGGGVVLKWNLFANPAAQWGNDYAAQGSDTARGVAVNAAGDIYVTGYTNSTDLYTSPFALQPNPTDGLGGGTAMGPPGGPGGPGGGGSGSDNSHDAFVVKLDNPFYGEDEPSDDLDPNEVGQFDYSTYLGGLGDDQAYGIAVDADENAYVTGGTTKDSFPTTFGAYQNHSTSWPFDEGAAFVSKVNDDGTALVYSTLLGGSSTVGYGIAVDDLNRAYVTGQTKNPGSIDNGPAPYGGGGPGPSVNGIFPLTADATDAYDGVGPRAFLTKFNDAGSDLVFSTFHGARDSGQGVDVRSVVVDSTVVDREAVIAGSITAQSIPVVNAAQPTYAGGGDGFVAKWIDLL
jgi:hypothetical protein